MIIMIAFPGAIQSAEAVIGISFCLSDLRMQNLLPPHNQLIPQDDTIVSAVKFNNIFHWPLALIPLKSVGSSCHTLATHTVQAFNYCILFDDMLPRSLLPSRLTAQLMFSITSAPAVIGSTFKSARKDGVVLLVGRKSGTRDSGVLVIIDTHIDNVSIINLWHFNLQYVEIYCSFWDRFCWNTGELFTSNHYHYVMNSGDVHVENLRGNGVL